MALPLAHPVGGYRRYFEGSYRSYNILPDVPFITFLHASSCRPQFVDKLYLSYAMHAQQTLTVLLAAASAHLHSETPDGMSTRRQVNVTSGRSLADRSIRSISLLRETQDLTTLAILGPMYNSAIMGEYFKYRSWEHAGKAVKKDRYCRYCKLGVHIRRLIYWSLIRWCREKPVR